MSVKFNLILTVFSMLTINSFNANGLRNIKKMQTICTMCEIYKIDVLCLQETFWDQESIQTIEKIWNGKVFCNNYDASNRKGVAILVTNEISTSVKNIEYGSKGRIIKITIEKNDKNINVYSIYAPNKVDERKMFYDGLKQFINSEELNIIGGDFNDVLDPVLDRSKTTSQRSNSSFYKTFLNESVLVDVWRYKNPDKVEYSRRQIVEGTLRQSRIDSFLISKAVLTNVVTCFYKISHISDHSFVCLKCDFTDVERGPGMWVMNNSLLNDEEYCNKIHTLIDESLHCPLYDREKLIWWDNTKYKIKQFTKMYSQKRHKLEQSAFWSIQNELRREYLKDNTNIDQNKILELQLKLKDYELEKCKGAILRSKATWAMESDNNTSYFTRLEKYKQETNAVKHLINSGGKCVSDTMSILETEVEFFQELYQNENVNDAKQKDIFKLIQKKLNEEEVIECDRNITVEELTKSLNNMPRNKSPGFDGLTVEFYCKFWNKLNKIFSEIVSEITKTKEMTKSMKMGVISLIYKKKGDKRLLKNWRPITLLNVDYKIISKTIASRLKQVLPNIISSEQTCAVPGRDISDTLATVRDIIDYVTDKNIPAYIVKIDSDKAFDRISHSYLFNLLSEFGFGENFRNWIKILYTDISSAVKCNGHISKFFKVGRSVRQGCGLSALLYTLAVEPLNLICKSSALKGIEIEGSTETSLIYQHADDTTLTLANKSSVTNAFKIFDEYCQASGAKINIDKSEVLVINDSVESVSNLQLPMIIKNDTIEILGIHFGDKEKCELLNWKSKVEKIGSLVKIWKQRKLSLKCRANVIQTLFVSRILYALNIITLPNWVEQDLVKHIYGFLWDGKPAQVRRSTLIGKNSQGGLNIPDLQMKKEALRLKWFRKYFDELSNVKWKNTMNYFLRKYQNMGLTYEILDIIYDKSSLEKLPVFYRELLEAWDNINIGERQEPMMYNDIVNQPLFGNPFILIQNRMLKFNLFIKCGITKLHNLLSETKVGFKSYECVYQKIIEKYPDYCMMKFQSKYKDIIGAIPHIWKTQLCKTICNTVEIFIPTITDNENTKISPISFTSKICYDILRKRRFEQPISHVFVESFGCLMNQSFWKCIFNCVKNPDMTEVDLKIVYGIIWTKERLYRIKKTDNNRCPNCKNETEDILHMFIECDTLLSFRSFIEDVLVYFYKERGYTTDHFNKILLFGTTEKNKYYSFINVLLSTARFTIYKRRCYMSITDKLLDCKRLFNMYFKRQLNWIYRFYQQKNESLFQTNFVDNIPYVRVVNNEIQIKW